MGIVKALIGFDKSDLEALRRDSRESRRRIEELERPYQRLRRR
ncbi:hypothetical protein [Aeropyrum camini]|nr:hypothetical protein [Aeropyrum camini]